MTTSDYLEILQNDLDTIVTSLELEEGSTFSDIASMASNGEITKGDGGSSYTGPKVYKVASTGQRGRLRNLTTGDICIISTQSTEYLTNDTSSGYTTYTVPVTVTLTAQEINDQDWTLEENFSNHELVYNYMEDIMEEDPETGEEIPIGCISEEIFIMGDKDQINISHTYIDDLNSIDIVEEYIFNSEDGYNYTLESYNTPQTIYTEYGMDPGFDSTGWSENGFLKKFLPIITQTFSSISQYNNSSWHDLGTTSTEYTNAGWTLDF